MNIRIYQPWGGLGDNLQFSTIPELCHSSGIACYIAHDNVYRNKNIEEFVWDTNPFIKKQTEHIEEFVMAAHQTIENKNVVECIEIASGFENKNHYPKIYYTPNTLPEFKDKIIVDIKTISIDWPFESNIYEAVKNSKEDVIIIKNNHTIPRNYSFFEDFNTLEVNNLFYYSDIINSCRAIYTVPSGISVLSPTIKHMTNGTFDINVYTTRDYSPERWHGGYWFNNVNYTIID